MSAKYAKEFSRIFMHGRENMYFDEYCSDGFPFSDHQGK